jgi:hypothetical protein
MCVKALKRVLRMTYEFRGLIVRHNLETRALAGAVTTIDAEYLAPPALDARVAQSPKLLDLVTLHDLSAIMKSRPFRAKLRASRAITSRTAVYLSRSADRWPTR